MSRTCIAAALSLLVLQPIARAGETDPATLAQVKQLASQGQDAQTTAQVSQFVDQNQNIITAIISGYTRYIKQVQSMTDGDTTTPAVTATSDSPVVQQSATATAQQPTATQQPVANLETSTLQPSTALRTSDVQPSGALRISHLAGYPSLPDLIPHSSVTTLSAAQNAYAVKVEQEDQARKQYLMQHPEGYTY